MVLVNSGFRMRKNFSGNYLESGNAPWEMFASPVLGPKILKNVGLRWRQLISLPGAPACLGSILVSVWISRTAQIKLGKLKYKVAVHSPSISATMSRLHHSFFTFRRFRVRILVVIAVTMFTFFRCDFYVLRAVLEWWQQPRPSALYWKYFSPFGAGIIFLILAHLYIKCE